ncbi:MAG: hypothetical protein CMM46_15175 [Rhodospirillaceae bacterium]|nr:hypothetical protein [Rhodospirillaceae bacterium]|tara:strand:+ start:9184 stop:9486 length:303 start_codon:yes stop_codon:yes gene_type:complete
MFSLQKLAVFAVIIAVLWLAFRFVGNLERKQKAEERLSRPGWRERFRRSGSKSASSRAKEAAREPVSDVDMVPCRVCSDYVAAAGAGACGRADCPYPPAA